MARRSTKQRASKTRRNRAQEIVALRASYGRRPLSQRQYVELLTALKYNE